MSTPDGDNGIIDRVRTAAGALQRALVECTARVGLTDGEALAALLDVAARRAHRPRSGPQSTVPAVHQQWVSVFAAAAEAVGCQHCGRPSGCRCLVLADRNAARITAGLEAVLPLITAALLEEH